MDRHNEFQYGSGSDDYRHIFPKTGGRVEVGLNQ